MKYYLGFDSSTQGIKAVLIRPADGWVSSPLSVHYGKDLPQWGCENGFLPNENPAVRHSPPGLWLDALEQLLGKMQQENWPMAEIAGISGSAQQHGTIYLNQHFPSILNTLDSSHSLAEQLTPAFSRETAPIWMDASTDKQCKQLEACFGAVLRSKTGAPATPRFSGPQIMKFVQENPDGWKNTSYVHLVSSFLASVLGSVSSPIDYGDGAGMNLLNLQDFNWDQEIANFISPTLLNKLPSCLPSATIYGKLAPFFAKYGLTPGIPLVLWSGDNPCSFIGCGGAQKGAAVISLGTSDTLSRSLMPQEIDQQNEGAIFGNPAQGLFSLICFTNGSLAREKIRQQLKVSWEDFNRLGEANLAYGENLMLPYFMPESTPVVNTPGIKTNFNWKTAPPLVIIRALLESQALTMRLHAGKSFHAEKIHLTGGASANPLIRQTIADVFQTTVIPHDFSETAALGAAIRAAQAIENLSWDGLTSQFCTTTAIIQPRRNLAGVYARALQTYEELEIKGGATI